VYRQETPGAKFVDPDPRNHKNPEKSTLVQRKNNLRNYTTASRTTARPIGPEPHLTIGPRIQLGKRSNCRGGHLRRNSCPEKKNTPLTLKGQREKETG